MAYDSKWWGMRSGDLVGSNTITQEISDSIKKFFSKKDGKAGDIFLVILSLFAFTLGLEGYSMIVGKFMVDMPTAVRIIVNLIPMAGGCYLFYLAFFNKFDSKVYMESAAGLCLMTMAMSLGALGADLGFLGGTKWMVYFMIFSIPVIYLATSTVGAVIYLFTLFQWVGGLALFMGLSEMIGEMVMGAVMSFGRDSGNFMSNMMEAMSSFSWHPGEVIFGWFFLLLILPHFMRYTDRPSYDTRKLFLGWIGGILLIHIAMNCFTGYGVIAMPFLMVTFYMAGKEYYADGKFWWNRPFQTLTILWFTSMAWSMSGELGNGIMYSMSGIAEGATSPNGWVAYIVNAIVVLGVIAWGAYTAYNDYKGEKKGNILLLAFPVVFVLVLLIDRATATDGFKAGAWIFSLYTIALGADYLMKGLKDKNYQLVALGIIIGLPILISKIKEVLADMLAGENGSLIEGLLKLTVAAGLLYVGMMVYNSTRPKED